MTLDVYGFSMTGPCDVIKDTGTTSAGEYRLCPRCGAWAEHTIYRYVVYRTGSATEGPRVKARRYCTRCGHVASEEAV